MAYPKIGDLPKIPGSGTYPHAFERDGLIYVSAENGDDAADYYGEFRGGDPWVCPRLEKWAEKRGCYWEWENPGCIVLIEG